MKIVLRLSAFLLILLVSSCRGKSFEIEFDMNPDVEANYQLVYYASDRKGGRWIESAAPIHLGKFSIECPTINPTVVYIYRPNGNLPETCFYAERGDHIKITGDNTQPLTWTIRGNKLTDRLNEWQSANLRLLEERNPESTNEAVASFVEKNKDSEINPLLLLLWYDRAQDPEGFVRLWNTMGSKLRKSPFVDMVAMPDLMAPAPLSFDNDGKAILAPGKEKFPRLKVRTPEKGKDVFNLAVKGRKASFISFYHLGDPRRHEFVDSLRNLARRHRADSTRLLIADICLDPDSNRWLNALRFDSLGTVKRGWWPDGPADTQAIKLGVGAYRTFVVFGPKGEVLYRGDNINKALDHLKTAMK